MREAKSKFLKEISGIRNQVVLILGGQPADEAQKIRKEAMKLKDEGEIQHSTQLKHYRRGRIIVECQQY